MAEFRWPNVQWLCSPSIARSRYEQTSSWGPSRYYHFEWGQGLRRFDWCNAACRQGFCWKFMCRYYRLSNLYVHSQYIYMIWSVHVIVYRYMLTHTCKHDIISPHFSALQRVKPFLLEACDHWCRSAGDNMVEITGGSTYRASGLA